MARELYYISRPFFLGLFVFALAVCVVWASDVPRDEAWEKYAGSHKKLQVALHSLVRRHTPDLKKTIERGQELALAVVDQRTARFYYLIRHYPDRIVRDQGFSSFVNFKWTDQDEDALRDMDRDYRKLVRRIAKLEKKLDDDPDLIKLQTKLVMLESDREYTEIAARFRFISEEIEDLLSARAESTSDVPTPDIKAV